MRVVILAAGEGVRLLPLTEHKPKHMIPLAGKPIIQHIIEAFKFNHVHKFTIVVGYLREVIETYLSDGSTLGVDIEYIHQPKAQGTAHAVAQLQNQIEESRFILCYGDVYASINAISDVVKTYSDKSIDAALAAVKVEKQDQYGQVTIRNGFVKNIIEKPKQISSDSFANAGIYIFEHVVFNGVKSTVKSPRGELELTDSIMNLIRKGLKVKSIILHEKDWLDIGRPWDLLEANKRALQVLPPKNDGNIDNNAVLLDSVTVRPGARILSGTRIEGPVYIGDGSIIGPNCYIRPNTSIGQNARVGNGCEIKNSIIMDETKVPHQSYFGDSIIGERCNFGAGTITGNLRLDEKDIFVKIKSKIVNSGRKKLGAIIGDDVSTGINVNFMPGVKIGSGTLIGPGITVSKDLPSNLKILLKQRTTVKKIMIR